MNTRFVPDLEKINAKFEGYKLDPFKQPMYRKDLFEGNIIIQSKTNHHRLGFRDLQARIRYSQLIYGFPLTEEKGTCFCIDKDLNLHMIVFNKTTKQTEFFFIVELIKPLSVPSFTEPADTVPIEPQLPTAIAISPELLLVSNGVGDIELIGIEEKNGTMLGTSLGSVCYLGAGTEGISPVPCMLLTARKIKEKIILVVSSRTTSKKTEFNISTLEMNIPTDKTERLEDGSFVLMLNTLHIQKGDQVPVYCSISLTGEKVILASESRYVNESDQSPKKETIPMQIENPYKWSQEGSDITVQFQLPENIPKSCINCKFVTDHLSLIVQKDNEMILSFPYRKLWSKILPDECLWTFESNTLTLFITKSDENTRWPQLFDLDDGVLEDLSLEKLSEINNKLEKFTGTNDDTIKPATHPAATDMDEEIDEANEPVIFSVYNLNGDLIEEFTSGSYSWICQSFENPNELPSICLQMDVDGIVFNLIEENDKIRVKHTSTFDAFGFVQASKRDARFIHYSSDFISIIESSRNAYIYFHHNDKRIIESQTLIDLTQGHDIDIIGAQLVLPHVLAVLTESQIVFIQLTDI